MKTKKAVHAAVAAIYFGDTSDYASALWEVVNILDPKMASLLVESENEAFEASCKAVGLPFD
jgi:hypothetical protein